MDSIIDEPPRWQYRFVHFSRGYERMTALIELAAVREFSDVEQEALIGRFAVAWELAWKLLKDYLQYNGVVIDPVTPRSVIRAAFTAELITSVEPWFAALDARNDMAYTYSAELFKTVMNNVMTIYHSVFAIVFTRFEKLSTAL